MYLSSVIANYPIMLLECYVLYRLYGHMLTYKYNQKYRFLSLLLPLSFSILRYQISITSLNNNTVIDICTMVAAYASIFLCGLIFYTNSIAARFLWTVIYLLVISLSDLTTLIIFSAIGFSSNEILQTNSLYFASSMVSKITALIIVEVIGHLKRKNLMFPQFAKIEIISIICLNIILIIFSAQIFRSNKDMLNKNTVLTILFLLCFNISILTFFIIFRLSKKAEEDLEEKLLIQQLEMENKMNIDMANMVENLRSLRHDMNNHIIVMKNLIHTNQYTTLQEYIDDMCDEVSPANDFIFIKDRALSALLYNKALSAKLKQIEFDTLISVEAFDIPDKDMCSLLGNLLDNAIEAAEKVPDNKYIQLIMCKKGSVYYIECSNTFCEMPIIKNNNFISSKESQSLHGIGTKNIRSIVNKYSGSIEFTYYDLFKAKISLPCLS